ncbi:hypothetical protein HPS57_06725 [Prevotella sp. PINT]|uniref:hypothetical protein n=1 Tax=Palleniella intestinalis TaxID=2736291 RepID=UPI001556ADE0|nr:hypothetical protein [Palleniella intestinalis]NPD81666.1 hypothetical protein [Palleniella intestinalis]
MKRRGRCGLRYRDCTHALHLPFLKAAVRTFIHGCLTNNKEKAPLRRCKEWRRHRESLFPGHIHKDDNTPGGGHPPDNHICQY